MTIDDPSAANYTDQADVRAELTRTFEICQSCRRCVDLCASFPTLFDLLERWPDRDPGRLTPADQDRIVDLCHQCNLCALDCPHGPAIDTPGVHVPHLMLRATAMQRANHLVSIRDRIVPVVLTRTGIIGALVAPIVSRVTNAPTGSLVRRIAHRVADVAPERVLPPTVKMRFSTWFRSRPMPPSDTSDAAVAVFPSCLVEYSDPTIGHDLVKVYERNGIGCSVPDVGCCGAPLLQAGDTKRFTAAAASVVRRLADEVRSGKCIVVAQPVCHRVLRHDYGRHLGDGPRGADAALVAGNTYDAAEYLLEFDAAPARSLDLDFAAPMPAEVVCHVPCQLRVSDLGGAGAELLARAGVRVTTVERCSGAGGAWSLRAEHHALSDRILADLTEAIDGSPGATVGSCHLANTAIAGPTGVRLQHPVQVLARAYGFEPEP